MEPPAKIYVQHRKHRNLGDKAYAELYMTAAIEEIQMLETIIVILVVLWLLGFSLHIGGGLIHVLLVIALIVIVLRLLRGRPAV